MRPIRNWAPLIIGVALAALGCGCASHYDLTLANGNVIRASTKPVLTPQGHYVFKDLAGEETVVNSMRVRQIETVRRGSRSRSAYQLD